MALREGFDSVVRVVGLDDPRTRCWIAEERITKFVGARNCYKFCKPQALRGIFIDEFEGKHFIENARQADRYVMQDHVWLEIDDESDVAVSPELVRTDNRISRIWELEFVGRKASGSEFGHLGMSDGLVIVDRVTSARLLVEQPAYLSEKVLVRKYR